VIVSVPYRWGEDGMFAYHDQDPVDEAKLRSWAGRDPVESAVVDDGHSRLLAVYRRDSTEDPRRR
jgi:hypothetical protein